MPDGHSYEFTLTTRRDDGQAPPPYAHTVPDAPSFDAAVEMFCAQLINGAHKVEAGRGEAQAFEDVQPVVPFVSPPDPSRGES